MKYAIISDIHANIEALQAVLQEIDEQDVDQVMCLGDLVGYNASPNECFELILDREIPTIMGNHDAVACGITEPQDFNPIAKKAILWTRASLQENYQAFLKDQPEQRRLTKSVRLVHGSLLDRDQYLFSRQTIMDNVRQMRREDPEIRIVFFGHTHNQGAFLFADDTLSVVAAQHFFIEDEGYYLINPGSVGQPRDQDPRAAYLVYDDKAQTVEYIRLPYDIEACKQKIHSAELPKELADRLDQGW